MAVSKKWIARKSNLRTACELYRSQELLLTVAGVAARMGTSTQNVTYALQQGMTRVERRALAAVRYSVSKTGEKNPMKGKTGDLHHNWIGLCDDGYGYLTCLHNGKRRFVHRVVMAEALKLPFLPKKFQVHHIDGDPKNNELDNLALVTVVGHQGIHYLQSKDSEAVALKKSTIAEFLRYSTLLSKKTRAI